MRKLVEGSPDAATRNSDRLLRFEQMIGIDVEHSLQRFALMVRWEAHLVLPIAVLIMLAVVISLLGVAAAIYPARRVALSPTSRADDLRP